ncbi:serine/threonine-protein kinase VRK1-like isoform X1 [Gordionus sp. m RMFG-2023]|uniref:serine/threonine-protein kinase VRK1-like isoform X1 n=1 Tax=Gordionus sp. m RMFG-2023 TaxID=3053472 RepID=UPI0031FC741C
MPAKKKPKILHKLPEKFPANEILTDLVGNKWKLGVQIGIGGFGAIYLAIPHLSQSKTNLEYVAKIEPFNNGPLFTEMHFYQRCCKREQIEEWIHNHNSVRKILSLAIPYYIACGSHTLASSQNKYRFLIMERFGPDLEKTIFNPNVHNKCNANLRSMICHIAIRLLYALQYIHEKGYVHSDIKASNIVPGISKSHLHQIFLLDYGLVSKYKFEGEKHKTFKIDNKKGHDGTVEFTSIDAHNGTEPSRRSDLEVLGYNLLRWSVGKLPWETNTFTNNPELVMKEKIKYLKNIPLLMKACFKNNPFPVEIQKYFQYFNRLKYEEMPDYELLREDIFNATLKQTFKINYKDDFFRPSNSSIQVENFKKPPTVVKIPYAKPGKSTVPHVIVKNEPKLNHKRPLILSKSSSNSETDELSEDSNFGGGAPSTSRIPPNKNIKSDCLPHFNHLSLPRSFIPPKLPSLINNKKHMRKKLISPPSYKNVALFTRYNGVPKPKSHNTNHNKNVIDCNQTKYMTPPEEFSTTLKNNFMSKDSVRRSPRFNHSSCDSLFSNDISVLR